MSGTVEHALRAVPDQPLPAPPPPAAEQVLPALQAVLEGEICTRILTQGCLRDVQHVAADVAMALDELVAVDGLRQLIPLRDRLRAAATVSADV